MGNYLAEKYARLLNEEDIVRLFSRLEKTVGSRSETADKCGITRKAIYDWEKLTQPMKINTKEKVLEQLLEYLPDETMEYLARRTVESASEVLMSYITLIYESAFEVKDESQLTSMLRKFEQVKKEYSGLIYKKYEYELDDLTAKLENYAKSFGINWDPGVPYLYDTDALKHIISDLLRNFVLYDENQRETSEGLAIRLRIPMEVVNSTAQFMDQINTIFYTVYTKKLFGETVNSMSDLSLTTSATVPFNHSEFLQIRYKENKTHDLDLFEQAATTTPTLKVKK